MLVEINCQTDFVARNEEFKAFVELVGMQIASMTPEFVRPEDVPDSTVVDKRRFFAEQLAEEDAQSGKSRPAAALDKIVEGKVAKWKKDACLLDQPSVQDDDGRTIGQMGQPLYQYQAPTGFPDRADQWMSDGALIARLNFAVALTSGKIPDTRVNLNGFKDAQAAALYLGSPDFQKR